jgi:hypothetical protein
MRKIALAIILLAFTATALGDVTVTIERGKKYDANDLTISYDCNEGEEVRAFALNIDVNNSAYAPGSGRFSGDPNVDDYYVAPGSITFTIVDGNTVIDQFGTPVAEEDANGGVLEVASLYAAADPNHSAPPAASGDLAIFGIDCTSVTSVGITLSENGKRGGVVLKDPNEAFTLNLPGTYVVDCNCWTCPGQAYGDATGDGTINIFDYLAFKKALGTKSSTHPHGTATGEYNCCADFTQDGSVNIFDYLELKKGLAAGVGYPGPCADMYCP